MSNEMQGAPQRETQDAPKPSTLLDRSDIRVKHATGISGAVGAFVERVRSGDLGSLPVIAGLVIIWTVFTSLNPVFLSANNLVNLLFDSSTVGVISLGIVCILMVGEIDLSVGSVSGLASALLGMEWVNQGWPVWVTVPAVIFVGGVIGWVYSQLFNRFGMPSFVSTLAGLLAFLGLQLYVLGSSGSINLPYESGLVKFGQVLTMPHAVSYVFAALPGLFMLVAGMRRMAQRKLGGLSAGSLNALALKASAITLALELAAFYLNLSRGVPWMFCLFAGLVE